MAAQADPRRRTALERRLESLLRQDKLEAFRPPPDWEAIGNRVLKEKLADALERGDTLMAGHWRSRLAGPPLRPVTPQSLLDPAIAFVENAVRSDPIYAQMSTAVLVSEYPTGTFEAESMRFDEGYLILIGAGTTVLLSRILFALVRLEDERALDDLAYKRISTLVSGYVAGHALLKTAAPPPR